MAQDDRLIFVSNILHEKGGDEGPQVVIAKGK